LNDTSKKTLELLFKQVLQLDDATITEALNPIFTGEWMHNDLLSTKEKAMVGGLLKRLSTIDEASIKAALSLKNTNAPAFEYTADLSDIKPEKLDLTRALLLLSSYLFYQQFHFPQAQVGEYNIANDRFEKVKWLYRYWFNQLEVPEKDTNLVQHFREQDLDFTLEDFRVEQTVTLSSAGDLLAVDILTPDNTTHLFDNIQDFYSSADIVCANLETTVDATKPFGRTQLKGQPAKMNTSVEMFQKFHKEGGINYFSTANNHSLDWGEEGLFATLDVLENEGAYYAGTNRSLEQQEDVCIIEQNGIKIAMLSYTFDLNGNDIPDGKTYLVNEVPFNDEHCDLTMIIKHVARAKEKGADIIVACCHWGWEFEMYPHNNVMEIAKKIIASGVDVILGNHPHVSQPLERISAINDVQIPNGLIVYAYGDFVSYHPESRNSKIAYVTKFDIVKGHVVSSGMPETRITNLKLLPIYIVNEEKNDGSFDCRIVKFNEVLNNPDKYGLTHLERTQLPHLNDVVLHEILLPKQHANLLAK